jgi:hypothetical protein
MDNASTDLLKEESPTEKELWRQQLCKMLGKTSEEIDEMIAAGELFDAEMTHEDWVKRYGWDEEKPKQEILKSMSHLSKKLQPSAASENATRVVSTNPTQEEEEQTSGYVEEEPEKPVNPDDNFRAVVCPNCIIYETVGCQHCGLYQYGYKHKNFNFRAEKI